MPCNLPPQKQTKMKLQNKTKIKQQEPTSSTPCSYQNKPTQKNKMKKEKKRKGKDVTWTYRALNSASMLFPSKTTQQIKNVKKLNLDFVRNLSENRRQLENKKEKK